LIGASGHCEDELLDEADDVDDADEVDVDELELSMLECEEELEEPIDV